LREESGPRIPFGTEIRQEIDPPRGNGGLARLGNIHDNQAARVVARCG
jgi:hypothetical protein